MKNIVIVPNESKDIGLAVTKKLIALLIDRANIHMSKEFSGYGMNVSYHSEAELYDNADCVIVLGGDGTILHSAEPCGRKNIPIMGINLGRVGFMTEVNVSEMEQACSALLDNDYKIEKRMMMRVEVIRDGGKCNEYIALNDAVISKSESPMILIEVHSDDEKINEYSADGLIISTPTGSTGYSLSAGGPVADPTMELFIASPICAHMLHARPALIPCDKPIELGIDRELGREAVLTVDGNVKEIIGINDKVVISKSEFYVSIIKLGSQSFYEVLIDKLK
ncbi:MAG: NAD(+)/NADH kinase [Clostridia bacterium]|nr:NAD(+)/NADH kinase [Clostridia bacterium]